MMNVGWIGCGNMGRPMAMHLLQAGYRLFVNDVVKDNANELIEAGAGFLENPRAVAEHCDVIFTMVPNGKILGVIQLDETTGVAAGLSPGKIIIDMSTVSPAESAAVCGPLEAKGCDFLRAPVTGSTSLAASASLGVFASGKREVYDKLLPLFQTFSNHQHYLGTGEQSRVLKLAINLMIAVNLQMLAEAMLLAEKSGLDRAQTMDIIGQSAAGAPVIRYKTDNVVNRDYTPAFSVAMMEKDLDLVLSAAKEYSIGLPVTSLTRQFLAIAHGAGNAQKDFSCLVESFEKLSH